VSYQIDVTADQPSATVTVPAPPTVDVTAAGPQGPPGPPGAGLAPPALITGTNPATVPLTVQGAASQSADLFDVKNSDGTVAVTVNSAGQISTPKTELILAQTGDSFGTTILRLRNRAGSAGAIFSNSGLNLVDFGFQPSTAAQANLRMEGRSAQLVDAGNATYGEIQIIMNAQSAGPDHAWFGQVGAGVLGRFAVGGAGSYGGGAGPMIFVANDTADPTTNPTGGVIIFAAAGVLKARTPNGTITTIAPAAAPPPGPLVTRASGDWFYPLGQSLSNTVVTAPGTLYANPWQADSTFTLAAIQHTVSAAGSPGNLIRVGIYADSGGYPAARLYDSGPIMAGDVIANPVVSGINLPITAGTMYWLATATQAGATGATLRNIQNTTIPMALPIANGAAPAARTIPVTGYNAIIADGALPNPFPAGQQAANMGPRMTFQAA
jgi:hypothetical protein